MPPPPRPSEPCKFRVSCLGVLGLSGVGFRLEGLGFRALEIVAFLLDGLCFCRGSVDQLCVM